MGNDYCHTLLEDRDFSFQDLRGTVFYDCTFKGCSFEGAEMQETEWENCLFQGCNITNPVINQAVFHDLKFCDTKLMGLNLYQCRQMTFDLHFDHCRIHHCNFTDLIMKDSSFRSCEIKECFFQQTNLRGVCFDDSVFHQTLFHGTDLREASFRRASGYAIDPQTNQIKKAKFTVPEVLNLLSGFGVKIEDP